MSLYQRSRELAPLAWEPQTWHEATPGPSVRCIDADQAYTEWLRDKAAQGFAAMDDQLHYSEVTK